MPVRTLRQRHQKKHPHNVSCREWRRMKNDTVRVECLTMDRSISSGHCIIHPRTAHSEKTVSQHVLTAVFFHHLNPTNLYPTCTSRADEFKLQFSCICVSDAPRPRSSRSCARRVGASGKRGEILHSKGVGRLENHHKSAIDLEVYGEPADTTIP